MIITDVAVRNRATVAVLVALIVAAGASSYLTLPREAAPDVSIPYVLVTTSYQGVSPQDVETSVTMKIEKELAGIKGLKELRSSSAEGFSTVVVEFQPDVDIETALQNVRDRVDVAKPDLPADAEEPSVKEINISEFPIITVSLSGNVSPVRLKAIADELEDAIEAVPGVLGVDVLGALEREIRLEVDPDRLAAYDLTVAELLRLVPSENVNISAGALETEGVKFNVRVPAEFVDPGEVDGLLLTVREGLPIYLADVARVTDTFKDRVGYSRLDGAESVTLAVRKRTGANIIAISDEVRRAVEGARRLLPRGVSVDVTSDQADYVRRMVADLENNILSGLILVVAVLMFFLGWRTSVIVALAVPLSMLISFAIIQALGYTLNMIVLFSLVLALGMLVDNAIVIVENVYRHRQSGLGRAEAAVAGTREVAWPVATSTATTVAAFFPVVFMPGIMGEFMKYLPITVIIVLASSLFVALVISPTVCAVVGGRVRRARGDHPFVRGYRRLLEAALAHRWTTVSLAALVLLAAALLYVRLGRGKEFFPRIDPERAVVNLRFPQGTNIRETDRLTRAVEGRVEKYRTGESPDLEHLVGSAGSSGGGNVIFAGGSGGPHLGSVQLIFKKYEERTRSSRQAVLDVRREMADLTGAEIKVEAEKEGPPTGAPVSVRLIGRDFQKLEELSGRARRLIADVPGLVNLQSDFEAARPELVFIVDRRRAMLSGVNTQTVGQFLKTAVFGRNVGTYRQFNDEYDITVRLPLRKRVEIRDLFALRLPNDRGESVPLGSLGRFEYRGGLGTISRVDQKRVVTLTADAEEGVLSETVLAEVQRRLADLELPAGCEIRYVGEKEEQEETQAFLGKAFLVALLLILMILVAQFNSFRVPAVIMTTVVLSLIGVLLGLLAFRMPFNVVMTGIGVISLAGVVVNNAIVLLDYTRRLQRQGLDLLAAAVQAGQTRLRPVLLTATTTILGLVPMATGISFDFRKMELVTSSLMTQFWRSMAIAVICGLAFATVLTLVVVPTLYVSLHRLAARFGLGGLEESEAAEAGS